MPNSKKRILVVDDEPDIVELYAKMLVNCGYDTIKANSGEECIAQAMAEKPDLIFLDIMMESMDGWTTAKHIKHNPLIAEIPIIMVTGKKLSLEDILQRAMLIEDYVMKPVNEVILSEAIENLFIVRDRFEQTLAIASKSGVRDRYLEKCINRYRVLYPHVARMKNLLTYSAQIYTERVLDTNQSYKNVLVCLNKGLKLNEKELTRLEKSLKKS